LRKRFLVISHQTLLRRIGTDGEVGLAQVIFSTVLRSEESIHMGGVKGAALEVQVSTVFEQRVTLSVFALPQTSFSRG
jgi:hypothetical protein